MNPHTHKAIEDAVKGGWRVFAPSDIPIKISATSTWPIVHGTSPSGVHKLWPLASALLDPQFWQCLGKQRGWGDTELHQNSDPYPIGWWILRWHTLIDHLGTGGSIEDYFKSIDEV